MPARLARRVLIPAGIGLTLAACGAGTATPAATPLAAPSATPHPDAIVWAVPQAPSGLDPARMVMDPVGERIAAQVYDRLVGVRPGTAQLAPGLATTWNANVRDSSFTFTLRPGLKFHDGSPLDEQAVVWNFQRWMDPQHESHFGRFPSWEGLFGGVIGQEDQQGQEAWLVESVEAVGPLQVRFKLRAPFTPFLYHLAMVPFGLASPAAVRAQGERYGRDPTHLPVGSGPFKVAAWNPDGSVQLEPFGDYWAGAPAAPGLHFRVIPEAEARARAVAEGRAHGADLPLTMPLTGTLSAPGVAVLARPARGTVWLMLNHGRPPLDKAAIRRAIGLAIDREALARAHFGPLSEPAGQLLPPGFLGHDPEIQAPAADPEAARRILAEEGATENFRLNIWVPNEARPYMPDPAASAEAVAGMLEAIGIQAAVRTQSPRQFLKDRGTGRFTAWLIGWEGQSVDPDNFWYWHFGVPSRVVAEGNYSNPALVVSLRDAQRMIDSEQRAEAYRAAAQAVDQDSARIYLVHPQAPVAVSRRLRNYEPSPLGLDDFARVTLSEAPLAPTASPPAPGEAGSGGISGTPVQPLAGTGTPPPPGDAIGTAPGATAGSPAAP